MHVELTEEERRKRALRAQRFARDRAEDPDGTGKFAPPKRLIAHRDNLVWSNKEQAVRSFQQRKAQSGGGRSRGEEAGGRVAVETDIDRVMRGSVDGAQGGAPQGKRNTAFVGNLNASCGEGDLEDLFRGFPLRQIRIVTGEEARGKGRGAYIEFASGKDLHEAVKLNGIMLLGKPVSIEMSHEMHGTEGTMSAGPNDTQLQLPIENLSPSCVDTDILHLFQGLDVREVDLQMDSSKRQCTGRALVQFGSEEAFSKALKYEGMMLLGRPLRFKLARSQDGSGNPATIRVSNLNSRTKEDDLVDLFKGLGIHRIELTKHEQADSDSISSIVEFTSPEFAQAAVKYDGILLFGRTITVESLNPPLQSKTHSTTPSESQPPPPPQPQPQPPAQQLLPQQTQRQTTQRNLKSPRRTVFVGNLDYGCVEGDLDSLFEGLAIEKRTLVVDKETGESRGYGYVDFKDEESFQRALERDKASLLGRQVNVSIPHKDESPGHGGTGERLSHPKTNAAASVFVGNLNPACTPRDLSELFRGFSVMNIYIARNTATGQSKEFGYVDFGDMASQQRALDMDGAELLGRRIVISPSLRSQTNSSGHQGQSKPICFDYRRGECTRGSACRFFHDSSKSQGEHEAGGAPRSPERVCFDFQEGTCFRGDRCKFKHVAPGRYGLDTQLSPKMGSMEGRSYGRKVCFDYQRGQCNRASCRFAHELPDPQLREDPFGSRPVRLLSPRDIGKRCFDFQRGNCTRGAACRYQHVFQSGSSAERPYGRVGAQAIDGAGRYSEKICFDYRDGNCMRGASCAFKHER